MMRCAASGKSCSAASANPTSRPGTAGGDRGPPVPRPGDSTRGERHRELRLGRLPRGRVGPLLPYQGGRPDDVPGETGRWELRASRGGPAGVVVNPTLTYPVARRGTRGGGS